MPFASAAVRYTVPPRGEPADIACARFNLDWNWTGGAAILHSRAIDDTGYVQPRLRQLREVRGTRSIYHNTAIQSWRVAQSGEVSNVQVD